MQHIFIVNKISGKGTAYKNIPTIKKICEKYNLDYEILVTEYPGHCEQLVKQYNDQEDVTIYSVGGDGTYLDVLNAISPNQPIGLLPCGSGNDFYRYFGGVNTNYEKLIEDTINAKPIKVDAGQTDRMKYANTTSLGIDAKINFDASRMIRNTFLSKGASYILSIIFNAIIFKTCDVNMTVDGKDYSGIYYIIACQNGKYYGNGVKCAPLADVQDGYFDLVLFKKTNRFHAYKTLIKYLGGKATEKDGIKVIKCKDVIIESKKEMACQSDGENYMTNHLECHMLHNYINLKVSE